MQKTTKAFDDAYKKLNPQQKQAVDTVEGPVMVIAGPGTGKTQILTLRIANIIKETGAAPENILALTFTESAAYGMRRRLADLIGSMAYKVNFNTFHSFANNIIRTYPEYFPRIIGSASATDIDQIRIMEEVIEELDLELLKPYGDPLYYLRPALGEIQNLKKDDISPKEFEKIINKEEKEFENTPDLVHEKGAHKGKMKGVYVEQKRAIEKNKELLKIYLGYEEKLKEKKLYDYDDMIMETVRVLGKEKDLLLRLQESYQYILADEHQDANFAQNKILELLTNFHKDPNLFIVGDEKQAIFRFQGASLENFIYFKKLHPSAVLVSLKKNYRSNQDILDASHSLIENNIVRDESLRVRLESNSNSKSSERKKIRLAELENTSLENAFVAQDISEKIKSGVEPQEIAVLFRNNADAADISAALSRFKINHAVESGQHILDDFEISNLVNLLRVIIDPHNNSLMGEVLFYNIFGHNTDDVFQILENARKNKTMIIEEVGKSKAEFKKFKENLMRWAALARNSNAVKVIETVITESGLVEKMLIKDGSAQFLEKLSAFVNEAKKLSGIRRALRLQEFLDHLETLSNHNIKIEVESVGQKGKVRLMTVHKSKGLEFRYVYLIGANDGHFGNKRSVKHFKINIAQNTITNLDKDEDERRLFYVALTRAKEVVTVSWAKKDYQGKELAPSQFVAEIDQDLCEKLNLEDVEKKLAKITESSFKPVENSGVKIFDKEYLNTKFKEQGIAVTALNNFLECPWKYFFNNLIRLPEEESKTALYGTAVHETLRVFFNKYRDEEDMSKKEFLELFKSYANEKAFSEEDLKESIKKGEKSLGGYYDKYKKTWPRQLVTEFGIAGVTFEGLPEGVMLRGKLDKIEWNSDGSVTVVDYKTAKPKSRNQIEGKTKDGDGRFKRQLIFYKILLDAEDQNKYKMSQGVIDFVEPDPKGNYKKESFFINHEEVEEIKNLVTKMANEVLNLEFLGKKCSLKNCRYCALGESIVSKLRQ